MTNFDKKMTKIDQITRRIDWNLEVRTEFLNAIFGLGNIVLKKLLT